MAKLPQDFTDLLVETFELQGHQIPYIGIAALIANKKAAGRHKDLADVEELERLEGA